MRRWRHEQIKSFFFEVRERTAVARPPWRISKDSKPLEPAIANVFRGLQKFDASAKEHLHNYQANPDSVDAIDDVEHT